MDQLCLALTPVCGETRRTVINARSDPGTPVVAVAPSLSNIDYPGGFYRELSPVHLNFVCALNGHAAPNLGEAFTYCELGCGVGDTTTLLAAAYPQGRFVGIDLNPSHIEQARQLAAAGQVSNVEYIAGDIARLDTDSLPDFDYVTLHGLYAWVPPAVQEAIRHFLRDKLRPGGIVYLSYNAMPGWGSASPLRRFFLDRKDQLGDDVLAGVRRIVGELVWLRDQGAGFFRDNPVTADIVRTLESADPRYIVHEYFSHDWHPAYFADVDEQLRTCGLSFVGQTGVIDSLLAHSVNPPFAERLRDIDDRVARESLRDFIQNRFFRRDVYIKPLPGTLPIPGEERFDQTLLGLIADPVQIPSTIHFPDAPSVTLDEHRLAYVKHRLGYRVKTFAELSDDPTLSPADRATLRDDLKLMAAGGFCAPCLSREIEPSREPVERIALPSPLNRVLLERHGWSENQLLLVSPVLGNCVALNGIEAVLLASLQQDRALPWVWDRLQKNGIAINSESAGTPIEDRDAGIQALDDAMARFLRYKLPKLAFLGVVGAAS